MRIIKKFAPCFAVSTVALSFSFSNLYAFSNGPPAYRTGAPGDDGTCNDIGCHNSFELNSGNAVFSITASDTYTPRKFIKIEVSFTGSSGKLHGFEMTALDANGNRVRRFKKIRRTTQVIRPNDFRGLRREDRRKYIEHTRAGTRKTKWMVKWKAPRDTTGPITFYAAGNEADGNGISTGDFIYTTTREINAASSADAYGLDQNEPTNED